MTINIERSSQPMDELLSIEEFAAKYGLDIVVKERDWVAPGAFNRFYAQFEDCEVKDGAMLKSSYGNGSTPEEAIQNYAEEIQHELLVFGAYTAKRRKLWAHVRVED